MMMVVNNTNYNNSLISNNGQIIFTLKIIVQIITFLNYTLNIVQWYYIKYSVGSVRKKFVYIE